MKKTAISSAVALCLGTAAGAANALDVSISNMVFGGTYAAGGTLTDTGTFGGMFSIDPFFGHTWNADAVAFWGEHGVANNWTGTDGVGGSWSYNFTLTDNQVAWGTLFNWSTSSNIAVLNIMDCAPGSTGSACTTIPGTPMQNGPFAGSDPLFNGTISAGSVPFSGGSPVPVPAAAWLMGSGLVGLVGVARRRKKA